jgi:membrane protease YdiL (CAAX protease family)
VSDNPLPVVATSVSVPEAGVVLGDPRERRMRWLELGLVTTVAFVRPLMTALVVFSGVTPPPTSRTTWGWIAGSIIEIPPLLVLAYVLSRNGRTFKHIGLRWSLKNCLMGVALAVAGMFAVIFGSGLIRAVFAAIGMPDVARASAVAASRYWPKGAFWTPWAIPYMVITPFYEEIFVRAYLMTELIELTGSATVAVMASVIMQSSYHLYYGWYGALTVGCMFLVYSLYFAKTRQAAPSIVAHWLYDLLAVVAKRG